ncbi:MAG: dihydroxy-acid dehydratase [Desulfobacterales bacterium]|nr:dihydroxy-acid dehydratase [Deltaproteobacteria bacterium]NNK94056.1 dihydroxy-acid dehydratase [Desulfobacterales bacterium]
MQKIRRRVESLAEYGRVSREALMKGAGFSRKQLERPFIGVVNGYGELTPGANYLNEITRQVKKGITAAGGTPVEFFVSATCVSMPHGGENYRWTLPYRDITASYIEAVTEINYFDALVMVTVCDDAIPANCMAAARLGLPTIIIPGGSMAAADYKGQRMDWTKMIHKFGELQVDGITRDEFEEIHDCAICGGGNCCGVATGNTGAMFTEALGLTLPGAGTVHGAGEEIKELGRQSGEQIMTLLEQDLHTGKIITRESLENAVRVFLAIGGSTNSLLHIMAIAHDAGFPLNLKTFDRLSRETPHITNVAPAGIYNTNDLHDAGGIQAVMKELSPMMNLDVLTVTGKTLGRNLEKAEVRNHEVIYGLEKPVDPEGGIAVVSGNLAPNGAIIKQAAVPPSMMTFQGPARVFSNEVEATTALVDGYIKAGDVVVIRYQGPKGDPGMRQTGTILANLLVGMNLIEKVALVTDGRASGTCGGLLVLHLAPEAAVGGPIAALQDGDIIDIDVVTRSISVQLSEEELQNRLADWRPPARHKKGFLSIYQKLVQQADKGAVLSTDE